MSRNNRFTLNELPRQQWERTWDWRPQPSQLRMPNWSPKMPDSRPPSRIFYDQMLQDLTHPSRSLSDQMLQDLINQRIQPRIDRGFQPRIDRLPGLGPTCDWVSRNLFFGSAWKDPAPFPGGGLPKVFGGGWKGTW